MVSLILTGSMATVATSSKLTWDPYHMQLQQREPSTSEHDPSSVSITGILQIKSEVEASFI